MNSHKNQINYKNCIGLIFFLNHQVTNLPSKNKKTLTLCHDRGLCRNIQAYRNLKL